MQKQYLFLKVIIAVVIAATGFSTLSTEADPHISGDTTVVQTFRYDTTMRAGMFDFPDDTTKTYEKIIMLYSMRCKNGLISSGSNPNLGCGEWDYNCYTFLIDSTQTDSLRQTAGDHFISNYSDTLYPYTTTPQWNVIRSTQQQVLYTSTVSETLTPVGTGTVSATHPFAAAGQARTQYLFTPAELLAAGFTAGDITGLGLNLSSLGSSAQNLRIRIRATAQTALNAATPELSGFTEVYFLNTGFTSTGLNRFNFHTPFNWDGISGLLLDISYTNPTPGAATTIGAVNTGFNAALHSTGYDNYLESDGGVSGVTLPASSGAGISSQVTVAFWCYGNPSRMPANTTIFEALGPNGERQMNLHLPWSDSNVYWDCGNDGTGFDRINKAATTSEIEGQWNFWALTKNTTTGEMKIYLNGTLWHSGTAKTKPISIAQMNVARSASGGFPYFGGVDEFSMWNVELSQSAIQGIMQNSITGAHPNYANLKAYYKFDEGSGTTIGDASPNNNHASQFAMNWARRKGRDLFRNFQTDQVRPATTFIRGTYTSNIITTDVFDSIPVPANAVIAYTTINNDLAVVDTNLYWLAGGYTYLFDENGIAVDSFPVVADDTIDINTLTYYQRRPMAVEIMNFITPYGINLNMNGLIGKTWEFDVTDYAPILRGRKYMAMEGGKYQEDNDIKFVFYEGTPPRNVHSLQQIWPNAVWTEANYSQIVNNTRFEPRNIPLSNSSSMFKIRSAVSGHGQEGEFISRNHTITLNGSINFTRAVWKECAENPVYPQGGTWVYDRAGWCPGTAVDTREYDISSSVSPGQTITLDYSLPAATNTGTSNYRINNQLVSYGPANFTLDAAVNYIKNPSNRVEFERTNPLCNQPVVSIRNTGSTPLTSLDITYGRVGGVMSTFNWTGTLNFLQAAEVTLPQPNWLSSNTNQFMVILSNPNGGADQYALNDTLLSTFNYPTVYPSGLVFELRTNNNGSHTTYTLKDSQGNNVLNKLGLLPNTIYRDTVYLPTDCYTFKLLDAGDDGLSWWANTAQGTGYMRIKNASTGAVLRTFNPDFGDNIYQQFTVNYTLPTVEIAAGAKGVLAAYPNPASDLLQVEFTLPGATEASLQLTNLLGQTLLRRQVQVTQPNEKVQLDVSTLEAGIYYVVLISGQEKTQQKVVISR